MILSERELAQVREILGHHLPGREIWVFGSRAHGDGVKPFSDLDLAIPGRSPLPLEVLGRLREAFSESDLPFKVDLVQEADTDPVFWARAMEDHEVIQGGPG